MELLCVCDFCHKLVSHGQPVRGVHHPSQICDKNHKFVTGSARFSVFCVEFSDNFCATQTQKEFWDRSNISTSRERGRVMNFQLDTSLPYHLWDHHKSQHPPPRPAPSTLSLSLVERLLPSPSDESHPRPPAAAIPCSVFAGFSEVIPPSSGSSHGGFAATPRPGRISSHAVTIASSYISVSDYKNSP